ncbi:MAG: single-stranded DNA-binding protein [Sphingomonadales bacterium]|uniref:Single-stranded DNA-binding protein n=2 Tax=Sphingomonadaceae TaxID=41297 RepID=A0A1L4A093_9SPHN|nr:MULTISPECIES: single-stranded DNA-binding protein [Sphingomonadaceae]MBK6706254.1 single-stranded DNA-binding protein [Sphingomonadales bacterium]API61308.1 single-stranded DNA-binding protein [Tardibacter chloracetimidivorans]MBB4151497.1 single-stranded DNA-binding protein [Sphingobium scionense]MBK9003549.1 single-stranded DNA-binding protein [Sphingomonadales bacterium]MBK9268756.1 single-stranded DNA-binding protein [Sphingomonadales bacterium]
MRNLAKFEIIGRIGEIKAGNGVVHLKIAANYPYKDENTGEWADDTYWNRVAIFREGTRNYIADKAKVGDLVRVEGRLRDSSYEKGDETVYTVDRIVDQFGILAHAAERAD